MPMAAEGGDYYIGDTHRTKDPLVQRGSAGYNPKCNTQK